MAKTKNPKPEATEATEAATKNEDQAVTGQPTPTPAVETLVVWDPIEGHATLAQLAKEGFPVVVILEPEGAYRAMVPAFGPIQTGVVGLTSEEAIAALEEASPQMLEDFKKQTGEDRPSPPREGCVDGGLTLEQYLTVKPGEWAPFFWPDTQAQPTEEAAPDHAGEWFLTDESAIRVLLAARGDKTNRAHQERRPGWLARARRKRDGKEEYIHLELIENPDGPMVDQAANARVASERGALNGQVTSWKRECKDLMDDIVNRLKTVSGHEEVRAELFAAMQAGEEWEGMQPKDAAVRDRCLEHLKRIDTLEDQIAEAESRLAEIEATLNDQRQHAQVVLDLKFTTTGNLVLHVSE